MNEELNRFFYPASIAVIGASETLASFGARYMQALLDFGYEGKIYAVNHSGSEVLGHKIYGSILDIPQDIDLASICVSARFVPDVLRTCLKKGVKAAIVLSSGFRESGEEGRRLEEEVAEIAGQGIRVMGPNCFGTYCPQGKMTVIPGGGFPTQGGRTAFMAQSGQMSEIVTGRSFGKGIRYSKVASYGNACNINEADLLDYLVRDEESQVIASYLEGVRDGRRFFEIARANAGGKPLMVWKVGLSSTGAAAAASHTGSLAGARAVWGAFFRQTGVISIGSAGELIDSIVGFECLPEGCGRKVALISGGGAGAVIGADVCEASGMEMPRLTGETIARLREVLPPVGTSLNNPLDLGNPYPSPHVLRSVLEIVAASDAIDVMVIRRVFFSAKLGGIFAGPASASYEEYEELLQIPVDVMQKYGKPVVIVLGEELSGVENIDLEEDRRRIRDYFFARKIPAYPSEEEAFAALSNLAAFKTLRLEGRHAPDDRSQALIWDTPLGQAVFGDTPLRGMSPQIGSEECPSRLVSPKGRSVFSDIIKQSTTAVLGELQCKRIMKEYGIAVTEPVLARSEAAALAVAGKIGFPVAMKIVSPQITHKSDIGGVAIGLTDPVDIPQAYVRIMAAAAAKAPQAVVEGVSLQKMAPSGTELAIGMMKDPQFGPVVMFGLGGTLVEVLNDVAFSIVPLSKGDAKQMIKEIRAYPLLEGYRGQPGVDIEHIEELLLKVSRLVEENPEIREMDINPLIAYADGAIAVDARIILEDGVLGASGR